MRRPLVSPLLADCGERHAMMRRSPTLLRLMASEVLGVQRDHRGRPAYLAGNCFCGSTVYCAIRGREHDSGEGGNPPSFASPSPESPLIYRTREGE